MFGYHWNAIKLFQWPVGKINLLDVYTCIANWVVTPCLFGLPLLKDSSHWKWIFFESQHCSFKKKGFYILCSSFSSLFLSFLYFVCVFSFFHFWQMCKVNLCTEPLSSICLSIHICICLSICLYVNTLTLDFSWKPLVTESFNCFCWKRVRRPSSA